MRDLPAWEGLLKISRFGEGSLLCRIPVHPPESRQAYGRRQRGKVQALRLLGHASNYLIDTQLLDDRKDINTSVAGAVAMLWASSRTVSAQASDEGRDCERSQLIARMLHLPPMQFVERWEETAT